MEVLEVWRHFLHRCWRWDPCGDTWVQELELPAGGPQLAAVPPPTAVSRSVLYCTVLYCPGLYGGVSGQALVAGREELWLVGGGNGSAGGETWVSGDAGVYCIVCVQCVQVLGWAGDTWSLEPGPALLRPRYGHCGATLAGQVVVVGGRGEEGVVDTVEVGTGGRARSVQSIEYRV